MCHSFAEWFGNGAQCQRERILDISMWPIWLYFLMWFKGFKGSIWGLDGCLSCWKQRAKVSDTMQAEIWSLGDEMRGMNEMRAIRRMACRMAQPDPQIFGKFQHEDHGVFVPLVLMQLESKCWCKLRRVAARHGWYSEKHWVKTCQDVSRRINDFDRNISFFFVDTMVAFFAESGWGRRWWTFQWYSWVSQSSVVKGVLKWPDIAWRRFWHVNNVTWTSCTPKKHQKAQQKSAQDVIMWQGLRSSFVWSI